MVKCISINICSMIEQDIVLIYRNSQAWCGRLAALRTGVLGCLFPHFCEATREINTKNNTQVSAKTCPHAEYELLYFLNGIMEFINVLRHRFP